MKAKNKKHAPFEETLIKGYPPYRDWHDDLNVEVNIARDYNYGGWWWSIEKVRELKTGKDQWYYIKHGRANSKEKCLRRINEWITKQSKSKSYAQKPCPTCGK